MDAGELSYDFLRSMLLQERSQNNLEQISEDFFDRISSFVELQERILGESFSLEQSRVLENSRKIILELKQTRLRKILFKGLKDFETNAINSTGLAREEKDFYRNVIALMSDYSRKSVESIVRVKILVDLPKIQSPTGVVGPFSSGETVSLDQESAQLLLEKKVAEKMVL